MFYRPPPGVILIDTKGLDVNMICGPSDSGNHRLYGGRALGEEGHLVPRDPRAPADHVHEARIALEKIRGFNFPGQPLYHRLAYRRRERSVGAEDLRGGLCSYGSVIVNSRQGGATAEREQSEKGENDDAGLTDSARKGA